MVVGQNAFKCQRRNSENLIPLLIKLRHFDSGMTHISERTAQVGTQPRQELIGDEIPERDIYH